MKSEVVALYAARAAAVADEWVKLAESRVRAAAAVSKRSDAELAALATFGIPGDLCNDQAHAALALLRARRGELDTMHPAHVVRAAETLAVLEATA